MITVIIAGGSGTRLWPLSTPSYPKHLLKINGDSRSLLQNTYERARRLSDHVYVVPEVGHAHHVKDQLPELDESAFVIEPARRGTASCIVAALAHVAKRHSEDEPVLLLHSDHYIRDVNGFTLSLKMAADASKKHKRIVLVGIEPTRPAIEFGYIKKGDLFEKEKLVFKVDSFKEKPTYEVANEYMRSGEYLWNCGYFVGSVNTFKSSMKRNAPGLLKNYEALCDAKSAKEYEKTYLGFENIAIDYALLEHADDLLVVPASFDWMDLGSYSDLHKAVQSDVQSNHVLGNIVELEDVENSFVQNYEDKPLAVIGLDNVVVVNTKDGILVARKDMSKKIGEVSKRINSKQD